MSQFEDLTDGRVFSVKVTPKASRNKLEVGAEGQSDLRAWVTVVPENGKANQAVVKLLSKAMGVPKSRLELVRGETSREKMFRVI